MWRKGTRERENQPNPISFGTGRAMFLLLLAALVGIILLAAIRGCVV
jgi:hypothetical protein